MSTFFRTALLILGLLVCVGAGLYEMHPWWFRRYFVEIPNTPVDASAYRIQYPDYFSLDELKPFLEATAKAEAINDPLQRCMSYPDPPGSHWSRIVVDAYCHYSTMPIPGQTELIGLISKGRAEELDRRLDQAVRQEKADPNSRGLIDRIYYYDFVSASPELRNAIESWKKQRPQSVFAYAASAEAYVEAGAKARDAQYSSETSDAAFKNMRQLLDKADADIAAALRLDPTLTPTYSALLTSRRLVGDLRLLKEAMDKARRAAPANASVYAEIMESAKPKWYGSAKDMKQVALDAGAQSEKNPLLLLMQPEPEAEAANLCGCDERTNPADYRRVFDRVAQRSTMTYAVVSAEEIKHYDFAVVYRSEALRFTTDPIRDHSDRLNNLVYFYRVPQLRAAVGPLVRNDADYLIHASSDLDVLNGAGAALSAMRLWDQTWAISEKLIQTHPEEPEGWIMRAAVQQGQPRAGLKETAAYLVQHFSNNPKAQYAIDEARRDLGLSPERKLF